MKRKVVTMLLAGTLLNVPGLALAQCKPGDETTVLKQFRLRTSDGREILVNPGTKAQISRVEYIINGRILDNADIVLKSEPSAQPVYDSGGRIVACNLDRGQMISGLAKPNNFGEIIFACQ